MAIRLYRAYSPGTRTRSSLYYDDITSSTTKTEVLGLLSSAGNSIILSCVDGRVIYSYPTNDSTDVALTHTVDSVAVTITAKTPSAAVGESSEDIVREAMRVIWTEGDISRVGEFYSDNFKADYPFPDWGEAS